MAEFRTNYESKKWSSLQARERASLTRITQGKGTADDFKAIQSLLSQYDNLAAQIMDRAIKAIDESVNARMDAIEKHRESKGKAPLTEAQVQSLIDTALKRAWDDQGPELVVIIEESMVKALNAQDLRLSTMFGQKLEEHLGPKSDVTLDDVVDYMQDPARELVENRVWNHRMEEIREQFRQLKDIETRVADRAELAVKKALRRFFSGESEGPEAATGRSPKNVLNAMLASYQVPDEDKTEAARDGRKFESIVEEAIQKQGVTLEQIHKTLSELQLSDSDRKQRFDEQAEAFWRKARASGTVGTKAKKAAGVGLMAGLGILGAKLLLSELMGGKVWEEMKKMFSDASIEKFTKAFIEMVEEAGKRIAQYIADQFKTAQNQAEKDAGVGDRDSVSMRDAKLATLQAQRRLDYQKQNGSPEDIKAAEVDLAKKQKAQADLDAEEKDSLSGASGKVGPPMAPPTSIPGATQAASSATPPTAVSLGTGSSQNSVIPATTMASPLPGRSQVTPVSNLGSGNFGNGAPIRPNLTGMPITGHHAVNPTLGNPIVAPAPDPKTFSGSVAQAQSKGVGGAISSIQNMQYRPSSDGSLIITNIGMMGD